MKNFILGLGLLLSVAATVTGCRETSKLPEPASESLPLIFPTPSDNPFRRYFDLQRGRRSINLLANYENPTRPIYQFTINPSNRDVKIRTVEVYKSFAIPLNASGTAYSFNPRVKLGDYSTFPTTVTLNSMEALKGLTYLDAGVPIPIIQLLPDGSPDPTQSYVRVAFGTAVVFTFEYILEDGRRIILTPLDTRGGVTGTFTAKPYAAYAVFQDSIQ